MHRSAGQLRTGCPGAWRPALPGGFLHRLDQVRQASLQRACIPYGFREFGKDFLLQQRLPAVQRLAPDIAARQDQQIEDEIHQRDAQ